MEVLWKVLIQIFFIGMLQSIAYILGVFSFTHHAINKNNRRRVVLCTLIFIVAVYLLRMLPTTFGVPTLLTLIVLILLSTYIMRIPVYPAIRATLIVTVINMALEMVNVVALTWIFGKERFDGIMTDPFEKSLAGIPMNVLFFIVIATIYWLTNKKKA